MKIETLATLAAFSLLSSAAFASPTINDTDLTGGRWSIFSKVPNTLLPDRITTVEGPLSFQIVREEHGHVTPVQALPVQLPGVSAPLLTDANGMIQLNSCSGTQMKAEVILAHQDRFKITQGNQTYRIALNIPCRGATQFFFNQSSYGGQALGIWQIALKTELKLLAEVDPAAWPKPVQFVWPDPTGGDFYAWGEVHLSHGDYWDVVGHELGHALYDAAALGELGGGQHKIDECYSETLALSEGWASFFSAWVSIDPNDPDAHFEYMVPRRAPIRIENIPADVCQGESNEWRVSGFFWDLVDLHDDGESSSERFSRVWHALARARVDSTSRARARLEDSGFDRNTLQLLWDLNLQK